MKRIVFFLALGWSLNASAADPVLSMDGYGDVVFGAKLSMIEKRLGEKAKFSNDDHSCDFVQFRRYPKVWFMVEEGVLTRADTDPGIPNVLGVSVGTTLKEIKRKYPTVIVEPQKYDPKGHYLIFKSADGKKAIVMEEAGGKVTAIRGGVEPAVEYVEGCS